MKYYLFIMWDIIHIVFLMFRFSMLCIVLLCFNVSFVYILPVALVIDWGLFRFCTQTVYDIQLQTLQENIKTLKQEGAVLVPIENEIIEKIYNELKKYQLYQWGNKKGGKKIVVLKSNVLMGQFIGVPLYNDTSIIIVPCTFYPQHYSDRARLAHEFSHCVSHDLMITLRLIFKTTIFLYPLVAILCNGINIISLFTTLAALVLFILQGWQKPYQEIEANNKALEIIKTLYGVEEQKKTAELFHKNLDNELKKEKGNDKKNTYKKAVLKLQLGFLERYLKTGEAINQISPINPYISLSYWVLYVLTLYSCISVAITAIISWHAIVFAITLYMIIAIFLTLNNIRIWKKKRSTFQKIGFI